MNSTGTLNLIGDAGNGLNCIFLNGMPTHYQSIEPLPEMHIEEYQLTENVTIGYQKAEGFKAFNVVLSDGDQTIDLMEIKEEDKEGFHEKFLSFFDQYNIAYQADRANDE